MRLLPSVFALLAFVSYSAAQSLEIMPGQDGVFADAQWLASLDQSGQATLFSRSRAITDYDEQTDLFTGAYLNYTLGSGFGPTLLGKISSREVGADAGVHYFRYSRALTVYGLASVAMRDELILSWFSIARVTPALREGLRLYSSLELFSSYHEDSHLGSVQRVRIGLDPGSYQFGIALNLTEIGDSYDSDTNFGFFLRFQK